MSLDTWPKWYACLTGPRSEQEASVHLRRAGYWVFYPHTREQKANKWVPGHRTALREVTLPLFPRYLFFALRSPAENFDAIIPRKARGSLRSTDALGEDIKVGDVVEIDVDARPEPMRGISAIVRYPMSKVPLQIPNAVITRIMDWADSDGLCPTAKALHWFCGKAGDAVEIKDGPLDGLITCIASVDALEASEEISVWVRMLGADHRVSVSAASVKITANAGSVSA